MTTADQLRQFIAREFRWDRPESELTDDYPVLDTGVIDSVGIYQIVSFIETDLGVQIEDEELLADNFRDVASIAQLVDAKRG